MKTIALEAASPVTTNWNAELSFEIKLKAIAEFYETLRRRSPREIDLIRFVSENEQLLQYVVASR